MLRCVGAAFVVRLRCICIAWQYPSQTYCPLPKNSPDAPSCSVVTMRDGVARLAKMAGRISNDVCADSSCYCDAEQWGRLFEALDGRNISGEAVEPAVLGGGDDLCATTTKIS